MANKMNYQRLLDEIVKDNITNKVVPKLLLHVCCAPCSSYCLEYLSQYFNIIVYFYNPNITSESEFIKRADEVKRYIDMKFEAGTIKFLEERYDPDEFYSKVRGLEDCIEGGERCKRCFQLRLEKSYEMALKLKCEYYTTSLTISPMKNAETINKIGYSYCKTEDTKWLPTDFKKREGYKRSLELSKEFSLYRQDYCGCIYSKQNKTKNI